MSDDTFDHTRAYNAILRSLSEYYDHVVRLEAQVEELGAALARYEEPFTMTLDECEAEIGGPFEDQYLIWGYETEDGMIVDYHSEADNPGHRLKIARTCVFYNRSEFPDSSWQR